ncbi:hypothetical protein A2344_00280 [Candidatus Peregrinibacteria bacterium RIFOXYB12_FULL_41_12]|nr:MAG: hypothetical protein A2244_01690 [Candidatus Peregrinibacteria bacterium RIFOXYA2_FULL_41_18]OGJ49454.1 MAG: hypothetical protein A2344_00280 [Candidatus Peregrinibacteria bacterium RIFOXYB12_FULL_41_12]OGJ53355.1 MAG: hypothetical protein A2448_01295 [Candidatus Peregrinibacteria bacterium RIFOXYC2_FULL_41_22]OGJ54354.1 MAG: hypothetical protein A2336_00165 [Candidatus Peregrinibacteria bacterium RIFOXYB2_FULL_41_88]
MVIRKQNSAISSPMTVIKKGSKIPTEHSVNTHFMTTPPNPKDDPESPYLASPKAFHLEMPLYHELKLSVPNIAGKTYMHMHNENPIDAFCIWCKKESVFKPIEHETKRTPRLTMYADENLIAKWVENDDDFIRITHACTRNHEHRYYTYYFKTKSSCTKIGQWPSTADFQIPQAEKYRKILKDSQYTEFTKGIGLSAHGVGIGSFVYLRRIFENLIEEAHIKKQKEDSSFENEKYRNSKMDTKIEMVKDLLPPFLVEHRILYGIMSKGIHLLTEEECLKYFEVVKIGIEQILDEKITQQEKEEKTAKARKAIQLVHGDLAKQSNPSPTL